MEDSIRSESERVAGRRYYDEQLTASARSSAAAGGYDASAFDAAPTHGTDVPQDVLDAMRASERSRADDAARRARGVPVLQAAAPGGGCSEFSDEDDDGPGLARSGSVVGEACLSLLNFSDLWKQTEEMLRVTTEEIEKGSMVRQDNADMCVQARRERSERDGACFGGLLNQRK
jgi:hypothetical protein